MQSSHTTLDALRADFDLQAGRSLALPIAGAIVWGVVGTSALLLPPRTATLVLLYGSGAIFPLGIGIAAMLGERLLSNRNPLAQLMALCVLMVNLLWAVHFTLLLHGDAAIVPLSLGISLGLHWIVFGWIVQHPLGLVHTILRTLLATGLWWLFPNNPVSAVALAIVIAYLYVIVALATRRLNGKITAAPKQPEAMAA